MEDQGSIGKKQTRPLEKTRRNEVNPEVPGAIYHCTLLDCSRWYERVACTSNRRHPVQPKTSAPPSTKRLLEISNRIKACTESGTSYHPLSPKAQSAAKDFSFDHEPEGSYSSEIGIFFREIQAEKRSCLDETV